MRRPDRFSLRPISVGPSEVATLPVRAPQASLATLYLHGNAGNITHRSLPIREIAAAGSSLLMVDYRGYGKSGGSPSENGLYADAEAAYLYLLNHGYSAQHIVLQGESLGTAVVVDLASRKECAGVVLEAAFTSGGDVANTVLPVVGPLVFRGFDSRSKITKVRAAAVLLRRPRRDHTVETWPQLVRGSTGAEVVHRSSRGGTQ